jgi:hypothetical protein
MSPIELRDLASTPEATLDNMFDMAIASGNEAGIKAVLHSAHQQGFEKILLRISTEFEDGGEELIPMLHELGEALDSDQIRARQDPDIFRRLTEQNIPSADDLLPGSGRILMR